jgi:hypothetical protein
MYKAEHLYILVHQIVFSAIPFSFVVFYIMTPCGLACCLLDYMVPRLIRQKSKISISVKTLNIHNFSLINPFFLFFLRLFHYCMFSSCESVSLSHSCINTTWPPWVCSTPAILSLSLCVTFYYSLHKIFFISLVYLIEWFWTDSRCAHRV